MEFITNTHFAWAHHSAVCVFEDRDRQKCICFISEYAFILSLFFWDFLLLSSIDSVFESESR